MATATATTTSTTTKATMAATTSPLVCGNGDDANDDNIAVSRRTSDNTAMIFTTFYCYT